MLRDTHHHHSMIVKQSTQILGAIATSSTVTERISCLELAIIALNHGSTAAHDAVTGGIVLVVQSWRRDYYFRDKQYSKLVQLYIELLTVMIFRSSKEKAMAVFHQIGADLISLSISAMSLHCEDKVAIAIMPSSFIEKLVSLKGICLHKMDKNESLIRLIQRVIREEQTDQAVQAVALQLLSTWAERPDNKQYLIRRPGLLEDVLDLATKAKNDKLFLSIATILSHFTRETSYKPELVQRKRFLETILMLLKRGHIPTCTETLNAVLHVATEASCRLLVCKHEKGALLAAIFEQLDKKELGLPTNHVVCRLISREIAPLILKNHLVIVDQLRAAAFAGKDRHTSDNLHCVSVLATQSLKQLARYVPIQNKVHPNLVEALTILAKARNAEIRLWAMRGLCEQSKSSTARFYIARSPCLLETIIDLARKDPNRKVKSKAMETLLFLASDNSNAKRLANNAELLQTLVENAKKSELSKSSARSAIQAILFLATHRLANKRSVAKTHGLMESLSKYGVSRDNDDELKRAALKCVAMLAPFV
jgi:hypothetical protein